MPHLTAEISADLKARLEEYRADQTPDMPSRAQVTRDALDEFLPELEQDDKDDPLGQTQVLENTTDAGQTV